MYFVPDKPFSNQIRVVILKYIGQEAHKTTLIVGEDPADEVFTYETNLTSAKI